MIELLLRFPLPDANMSKKHAYPDGMWVLFEPVIPDEIDQSDGLDESGLDESEHYEGYGSLPQSCSQKSDSTTSQESIPQKLGVDSDSHSVGDDLDGAATCRNVVGDKAATNQGMSFASASFFKMIIAFVYSTWCISRMLSANAKWRRKVLSSCKQTRS